MKPGDFDLWRARYLEATYDEHREFYRQIATAYPEQRYFNLEAAREFMLSAGPTRVLELGGWKGELAAAILPEWQRIVEWLNIEIAPQAVTESACRDWRYTVDVPDSFIWDLPRDWGRFDTFVASHVLEHLVYADVVKVLQMIHGVEWIYVDAPLPPGGSMWGGGESTHILEIGWTRLGDLIESYGYREVDRRPGHDGEIRWYRRVSTSGVAASLGSLGPRAADAAPPAP